MISIPSYLARGLDARTGERAVAANVQNRGWERYATKSGTRENGAALLLTAPIPQSLTLVEAGNLALLD
jgi:predicted NAD/FAD-dependent oxidoreductase